jgi:hypothetical protein
MVLPETPVRSHRRLWLAGGGVAAVLVLVLVWFQPHKLFIDDTVDDPFPVVVAEDADTLPPAAEGATTPTTTAEAEPVRLASGEFRGLDHGTSGTATVHQLADGSRVLRFEDFETDNGPDLRVWLSTADAASDEGAFDDEYVDLGALRGNVGNQNYELPADVDLDQYRSVVVWCRRFSSGFGVSPLV